jgi:hypothetical protein
MVRRHKAVFPGLVYMPRCMGGLKRRFNRQVTQRCEWHGDFYATAGPSRTLV